jgi:hypothetical protein
VQTSRGGPACCARPHCACVAALTPAACTCGHASARQAAGGSDRAGEHNVASSPAGQDGADAQAAKGGGKCKETEDKEDGEEDGKEDGKEEEEGKAEEEREDEDKDKEDAADDSERRDRDRHRQKILKSQRILTSCKAKLMGTDF